MDVHQFGLTDFNETISVLTYCLIMWLRYLEEKTKRIVLFKITDIPEPLSCLQKKGKPSDTTIIISQTRRYLYIDDYAMKLTI